MNGIFSILFIPLIRSELFKSGVQLHYRAECPFAIDAKNFCATFPAMSDRIAYRTVGAETYKVLLGVHQHLAKVFPDARLRALIEMRASQINGYVFCLNMHANEARHLGEPHRLHCDDQCLEPFERRLPQSTGGKKIGPMVLPCKYVRWVIFKQ
jgi:AhpD family alkylhydroperoxidase